MDLGQKNSIDLKNMLQSSNILDPHNQLGYLKKEIQILLINALFYLHHCLHHHHILIPIVLSNHLQSIQLYIDKTMLDSDFPSATVNILHFHCRHLDNYQEYNVSLPILDYSGTCLGCIYHEGNILDHKTCTDIGLLPILHDIHNYPQYNQNFLHIPYHNMLKF